MHELVPSTTIAALIVNPSSPELASQPELAQQAARSIGLQLDVISARSETDIDAAFATAVQRHAGAGIVGTDPFFFSRRDQIVAQAAQHRLPTIYFSGAFVVAGGLISYGNSVSDAYHRAGVQTGRLLQGATPSDLPVDQATKFELVINLKTAKTLGLTVPASLLARADEVIE